MKNKTFAKQFKGKPYPEEAIRPEDGRERLKQGQKSTIRKRQGISLGSQVQAFPGLSALSSFGPNKKLRKK